MRCIEFVNLKVFDVDFDRGTLDWQRQEGSHDPDWRSRLVMTNLDATVTE